VAADWHVLRRGRPNVLLVGSEPDTSRIIDTLLPSLQPPVMRHSSRPFTRPASRTGTLVLQHAADLSIDDQHSLARWLEEEAHPSLQIITTAPVSLLPRVDQGLFLDVLYYRLNVLCIFVGSVAPPHGPATVL
jgi:hypothetical protein